MLKASRVKQDASRGEGCGGLDSEALRELAAWRQRRKPRIGGRISVFPVLVFIGPPSYEGMDRPSLLGLSWP